MSTEDLVAFIEARLQDDETAARKAASLCGCHPPALVWKFDDQETDGRIVIEDDPHPGTDVSPSKLRKRWNGSYANLFAARHIVRHDPGRTLREIEAHRDLLQYLAGELADDETSVMPAFLLAKLGAVWSDHPGYDPSWSPTDE